LTKTLAITAIVLVAVVMGLSTIAPALQQAFAHDVIKGVVLESGLCPDDFVQNEYRTGQHPDHNSNGLVCVKSVCTGGERCLTIRLLVIDDIIVRS